MTRYLPHFQNVSPFPNRVSSAAPAENFASARPAGLTVDQLYGHSWTYTVSPGDAVYGVTDSFSPGPLDALADGRFVRVPYRRVPRISIHSLAELHEFADSVVSQDPTISTMWRGQTALHTLRDLRSDDDLLRYFGSLEVIEPSLLPSAARSEIRIEDYMDSWFGLLDVFLSERYRALRQELPSEEFEALKLDCDAVRASYDFRAWAFGVAQHYGLPSTGLDLTPTIDVALFFALHRFTTTDDGFTTIARVPSTARPVVFLFGIFQYDLCIDGRIAPLPMQSPRAAAQHAHFFQTGWGASPNHAAERIVAVLDLVGHESWACPIAIAELFPTTTADPFASFLSDASSRFEGVTDSVPLKRIYFT